MPNRTVRIEFADGWIDVRLKSTLRDVEYMERRVIEAGGENSATLQVIYALERRIEAWSFEDEITPDTIRDNLPPEVIWKLAEAQRETTDPNASEPSSNGTPPTKDPNETAAATLPGNGEPATSPAAGDGRSKKRSTLTSNS